ncbi:probable pectinesterase/pectinesterase inhibitor 51 [Dioscorea cayenensis subsp. rotundata]|uniref:Pectinesterase n=1 Tax=Dioscorea cayennensis subsp. rotundata TaxID=55577 RepID=A0AB40ASI2_DIOCR|nr:probable pectinesterase/pectinesterase inhibitor 51 [Dioscorea cayenensis subsp. rotundata]
MRPKPFPFIARSLLFSLFILSMAALLLPILLLLPLPSSSSSPSSLLLRACNATRFPSLCVSTLPPSPPTSMDLILSAISVSSNNLDTAQSKVRSLPSSDPSHSAAVRDCISHLSFSSIRLSQASSALTRKPACSRAFAGAALLYQYDCWSALKYVNTSHQISSTMSFLSDLTSLTSNALALISAFYLSGTDVSHWSPPQTERNGRYEDGSSSPTESPISLRSSGGIPRTLKPSITVCKSSQCDYQTVQAAVSAAPNTSADPFVIHIAEGIYEELVRIPFEKTNLVLLGDGMGKTVITNSLSVGKKTTGVTTYDTATVGVDGSGFMAANLTFQNTAGVDAHQAVAFRSDSDLSILESVEFIGHQDTLYARSLRQFYKNCRISGTIDFIFGNSASLFQDCLILIVPRLGSPEKGETNAVTAQGRTDPSQPTGFVFLGCTVNGTDDYTALYQKKPRSHRNYLGRPWKEYARTVFIQCLLAKIVKPEGWLPWRGDFALATLFYGEFGSSGPGANSSARVSWSTAIPAEHVGAYSVKNFIQGDEWIPSLNAH